VLPSETGGEEAEEQVAAVAVAPLRARLELERQPLHDFEVLVLGVVPAEVDLVGAVVLETGGVREEMADRDPVPARGRAGEVLREAVVEGQLAVLREQQDAGGGELLADGPRLVDRPGCRRHLVLEVREAVARALHHLAVPQHDERDARYLLLLHHGPDVIVDRVRRGDGGDEQGKQQGGVPAQGRACRHGVLFLGFSAMAWLARQRRRRRSRPSAPGRRTPSTGAPCSRAARRSTPSRPPRAARRARRRSARRSPPTTRARSRARRAPAPWRTRRAPGLSTMHCTPLA